MLKEVYLDALRNRESKVARLRDLNYEKIISEALSRWVKYTPTPARCVSVGVDSSWNKRAFQGLSLYVVDAIAVTSSNKVLATRHEVELAGSARQDTLESKAMEMESQVTAEAAGSGEADIICIDGSLGPRLRSYTPQGAGEIVKRYDGAVFVSKSSESRSQFAGMGSRAGDIYYYGHASEGSAGFSEPCPVESDKAAMFELYARLSDNTPVIRIETAEKMGDSDVRRLLNMLCYHSVSGYPYCLKLAHTGCKISNEDIDRLASILCLQHEAGARDALNE